MRKMVDARKERGHTIRSLAEAVGISPTTINNIENGRGRGPQYGTTVKIARELGVDPREVEEFRPVVEEAEGPRPAPAQMSDEWSLGGPPRLRSGRRGLYREAPSPKERLQRDLDFAEREDLMGLVESEVGNATGVDPTVEDVTKDPELVRVGLRGSLRALMRHLGREEVDRAYRRVFGAAPEGEEPAPPRRQWWRGKAGKERGGDED
ncbi:MAG: helix-turn-helix transcriptional regulator [Actinomycetota bacterium]|nr:helix-turn-helix transcriptional regulator [Actinomycetota bacterium]